ncbi:MAG: hypothetical protein ABEI53_02190 [Candidatus Magasanikbacteria bacterium]
MNKEEIKENLKKLRKVEPDKDFVEGTRRLVLATNQENQTFSRFPTWSIATAVATFVLVIGITSGSFLQDTKPKISSSLNSQNLQKELKSLSLKLEKINYHQETNRTIATALNEITSSKANHLQGSILKEEVNQIEQFENKYKTEKVNKLLNRVIF